MAASRTAQDVVITSATYIRPNLSISGQGFGSSGAQVLVNGEDVSRAIRSQTDTSITLKGSMHRLNLRSGDNVLQVVKDGVLSNVFVLNL